MTDITPTTRGRGIRLLVAAVAAVVITALTLAPRALVAPARGAFMQFMDAATAPLLVWIPYGDAERLLNTMLFVPLGATIALLLGRRAWPLAILAGFALSAAVEYAQASIPGPGARPAGRALEHRRRRDRRRRRHRPATRRRRGPRAEASARQRDPHLKSALGQRDHSKRAVVCPHDRRDDREPQSRAVVTARRACAPRTADEGLGQRRHDIRDPSPRRCSPP